MGDPRDALPTAAASGVVDDGPRFYESDRTLTKAEKEKIEAKMEYEVKKKTQEAKKKAPQHERGLYNMMDFDAVENAEMEAIKKAHVDERNAGVQARDEMIEETRAQHEEEVTNKGLTAQQKAEKMAEEEGKRAREETMRKMREEAERRAVEEV